MSSFQCDKCGMINIDCGKEGFKTPREIKLEVYVKELEEKLKIAEEALKQISSGVFLPAYRSYLAEQALQKMEEVK